MPMRRASPSAGAAPARPPKAARMSARIAVRMVSPRVAISLVAVAPSADILVPSKGRSQRRLRPCRTHRPPHPRLSSRHFTLSLPRSRPGNPCPSLPPALSADARPRARKIGRAPCRERVCQYVYISVVAASLKTKTTHPPPLPPHHTPPPPTPPPP